MNNESRTLLNRKEFMKEAKMTEEEMLALIRMVVERDSRATSPARKILSRLSSLIATENDESDPGGVTDRRTTEDKIDLVQYFHIVKNNSSQGFEEGLLDIHEKVALQRVPIGPGESLKVAVCSWCGYATQNQSSTGTHIRKDHEGILIVCECFQLAGFHADHVAAHWKTCPLGYKK